jgi:hypothetical protein
MWHINKPSLLKAVSAKHRSKCAALSPDSRKIARATQNKQSFAILLLLNHRRTLQHTNPLLNPHRTFLLAQKKCHCYEDIKKMHAWLIDWWVLRSPQEFIAFWRRHHCRWMAEKIGLCSALRAFERGGIFIVQHLLWHGTYFFRSHPKNAWRQKNLEIHSRANSTVVER